MELPQHVKALWHVVQNRLDTSSSITFVSSGFIVASCKAFWRLFAVCSDVWPLLTDDRRLMGCVATLQVIRETCAQPAASMGIDLSFDLRRERCLDLQVSFQKLRPQLRANAQEHQHLRLKAQHLMKQLDAL